MTKHFLSDIRDEPLGLVRMGMHTLRRDLTFYDLLLHAITPGRVHLRVARKFHARTGGSVDEVGMPGSTPMTTTTVLYCST